jgi:protoporphyrin/coproporphyrin ferrochelatase
MPENDERDPPPDRPGTRPAPTATVVRPVASYPKPPADGFESRFPDNRFDALIVVSFGGPEGTDDVMPFLETVTRGRGVPRERLEEVAHHYGHFGGRSPINDQNRALIAALRAELGSNGITLPIYFGNRNWRPFIVDALREMADAGVERALALFTSPYSSYSSCRQYRENIYSAQLEVGKRAPEVLRLRAFFNHPGFIAANAELVSEALVTVPQERRGGARLVFTAHSIPLVMASRCRYEAQLAEASRLVAEAAGASSFRLAFQSRSGSPQVPWLEPDILDVLRELRADGVQDVVVSPLGFLSDHVEVLYDLDVEATDLAAELGMNLVRAPTVGTRPAFVSALRELVEERLSTDAPRRALGSLGVSPDSCPPGCCLPGTGASSPWDD